ncbi:MMPL family transporter [Frankia sp. R43]|uniref:MMPL family transporter n=1 Tax=Frankia sp. R43 TaxID=269536 RepID=UPI0009F8301C|nr:MMPL family transporter [Frankia sp. R43]
MTDSGGGSPTSSDGSSTVPSPREETQSDPAVVASGVSPEDAPIESGSSTSTAPVVPSGRSAPDAQPRPVGSEASESERQLLPGHPTAPAAVVAAALSGGGRGGVSGVGGGGVGGGVEPTAAVRRPARVILYLFAGLAVVLFLLGGFGGQFQAKLAEVQKNDNAAFLPGSAESTRVDKEAEKFRSEQTLPGFIVYQRVGGLTQEDRAKIAADARAFRSIEGVDPNQIAAPQFSPDGSVANVAVPLIGKRGDVEVPGDELVDVENAVVELAKTDVPAGLIVHSAGPGGLLVAFIEAFEGIDGVLLLAAGLVVIVILLVVYRSPVLWFFPLFSAIIALGVSVLIVYPLAKHDVLTLNGQSQGILFVLVIGAGTDYALLLISRYREELHAYPARMDAMIAAWRGAAPAIAASAITVVLGLLCLALGELNSNKSLGPVTAIGIACTALVMLTFLPVFLVLFGRWVFWPRIPRFDQQADLATHGAWARFAARLAGRPRLAWVSTAVILLACAGAMTTLKVDGLSTTDSFTSEPDAILGQRIYDAHFSQGAGAPAVIITNLDRQDEVVAAASKVPGVAPGPGSVCVQVDYAKLARAFAADSTSIRPGADGCLPPALQVTSVGGRIAIDATLTNRYDTPEAFETVRALRAALHPIAGADALVGGASAINYDTQQASAHDRNLIIPIVLVVILIVLGVLLRALVAPLLLIATVVLSFAATLGVSAVFFNHVFGFADSDPGFPLFAFVFLVALGIDYNIFLMTRVREETLEHGTRAGIVRGLSVTGGVITSAGVVLAATFAVLGVLPLVFLAEVGFAVAFGVLLDTIIVRSILVPALSHDIGKKIWWPSALAKGVD